MTKPAVDGVAAAPAKELARGIVMAAVVAAVILAVAILPAEYGIDPTGAGKVLGLTAIHQPVAPAAAPIAPAGPAVVAPVAAPAGGSTVAAPGEARALTIASMQTVDYRADTLEVTLPPGKGLEVKTLLAKGATLIFSWKTKKGELVNHDFHGEPVNAKKDEFESFILQDNVAQSSGSLIAPFTGLHGWYWKNKTAEPVTVVLHASGFYADIAKK